MMADSSFQPAAAAAADLLIEPILTTEPTSKELIITTAMEGPGQMMESDVVAEVGDSPLPGKDLKEEEAVPSTLSTENGTMTAVTSEEESLSTLLRHMENEGGRDRGGDPGKR